MAMPRSASAGASSRRATRFSAPSGSPAASARPAAMISESIANPDTLVTPVRLQCRSPNLGQDTLTNGVQGNATHITGTRDEWLEARLDLLKAEKELTRRSDEIARQRQALPWVRVDKAYRFDTEEGSESLADLFGGRSQLLVYHFMFGPDYKAGCPSCSAIADGFNGFAVHLANHDVNLWAVSRAPLAKLLDYSKRMGWTFPWASSAGGDFNFDFNVAFTEQQQRDGSVEYNYARGGHAMDDEAGAVDRRRVRRPLRHRRADLRARPAGPQRLRARGRRGLSHLLRLRARPRQPVGHVPVARPRAQGPQRNGPLVPPSRRVRQELTRVCSAASFFGGREVGTGLKLRVGLANPQLVPAPAAYLVASSTKVSKRFISSPQNFWCCSMPRSAGWRESPTSTLSTRPKPARRSSSASSARV